MPVYRNEILQSQNYDDRGCEDNEHNDVDGNETIDHNGNCSNAGDGNNADLKLKMRMQTMVLDDNDIGEDKINKEMYRDNNVDGFLNDDYMVM